MRPVMSAAALWTVCPIQVLCGRVSCAPGKRMARPRGGRGILQDSETCTSPPWGPCVMNNTLYNCGDPVYAESINANGI